MNKINFTPIDTIPGEIDEMDTTKPKKGLLAKLLNKIKIL